MKKNDKTGLPRFARNITGRLSKTFTRLKEKGEKALIAFITAGDPDLSTTEALVYELEKNGSDIIELGIPFSDPMADGPTIQASYERALKKAVHLKDVLSLVKKIRRKSEIPIVLFGYYNPILSYGLKKFAYDVKASGADGTLVVDLPPEEAGDLKKEFDRASLDLIFLLTPTSNDDRMRLVASRASGFVYFVSVTGVTGARAVLSKDISGYVKKARLFTGTPIAVGFGISTPEQAKSVAAISDGVVVGSAIINRLAKARDKKSALKDAGRFVKALKQAMRVV
ncbi:MAG: tryptophan synthase subunit alpha [Deltaproteobacteria bacterium]|nr:tryptophan synthase subunit alpha [Deltaproteobacteria bacterium]